MSFLRLAAWLVSFDLIAFLAGQAWAQPTAPVVTYPSKTIRIVTGGVGGTTDLSTRMIAQGMQDILGKPVIVDNRPFEVAAIEIVAKAPPDGYALLLVGGTFWIGPLLRKVSYDPINDFSAISLTARTPNLVVVHPVLPVKNVKELIALAKARPGEINYSIGAVGGSPQIAAELFKSMAHVKMVGIPFGGGGARMNALLGGEVQMEFSPIGVVQTHVQSGRLKALAVTTIQRSALAPGLPTVAESGLPGYDCATMGGMLAPPKTPDAIITRLNQEIVRFFNMPDTKKKFLSTGLEVVGSTPEEFVSFMKTEMARLSKVIKEAGIRVD